MSRTHSSAPSISNALSMPVPVMIQTCWPSVTGEGDDMFSLRVMLLPPLKRFFQSGAPLERSTHQRNKPSTSARCRKIRFPQTTGVEPDKGGSANFHAMFSVFDQCLGRFVSVLTPLL